MDRGGSVDNFDHFNNILGTTDLRSMENLSIGDGE